MAKAILNGNAIFGNVHIGEGGGSDQTYELLDLMTNHTDDYYINPSDGQLASETGDMTTDFIEVTPGQCLVFITWKSNWAGWNYNAIYDANKDFIDSVNIADYYGQRLTNLYEIPSGAAYVRFSCEGSSETGLPSARILLINNYPETT